MIILQSFNVDTKLIRRTITGLVENVEVRVDGVCQTCLQTDKNTVH